MKTSRCSAEWLLRVENTAATCTVSQRASTESTPLGLSTGDSREMVTGKIKDSQRLPRGILTRMGRHYQHPSFAQPEHIYIIFYYIIINKYRVF